MTNANIVFLIGTPASGKSYYAARLFPGHVHLSMGEYQNKLWDEYRAAGGTPFLSNAAYRRQLFQANELLLADALRHIGAGEPVAIEGTFYKAKRRVTFTDAIRAVTDAPIDIYVVSPGEERFAENLRLRHLEGKKNSLLWEREQIEFPNPAEGFARVFELRDGQLAERMEPADPDIAPRARAELSEEAREEEAASRHSRGREELLRKLGDGDIPFLHVCECCGRTERLTPEEAYQAGWDYPPIMGKFGVISPRTCGNCTIDDTLWWAIAAEHTPLAHLSRAQEETLTRILGEPWSLLDGPDGGPAFRLQITGEGE